MTFRTTLLQLLNIAIRLKYCPTLHECIIIKQARLTILLAVPETGVRLVFVVVKQPKGLLHHVVGLPPLPLRVALQARSPDVLKTHVLTQRVAILDGGRDDCRIMDERD